MSIIFNIYLLFFHAVHISCHPISLFIFKFLLSFHIESFLFFSVFAIFFSQLILRLLVLDTQNNPVSLPSSANIGERELTNVLGELRMFFEQLYALRKRVYRIIIHTGQPIMVAGVVIRLRTKRSWFKFRQAQRSTFRLHILTGSGVHLASYLIDVR